MAETYPSSYLCSFAVDSLKIIEIVVFNSHQRERLCTCKHNMVSGSSASLSQETKEQAENLKGGTILCEECNSNPSKYKCPGCSIHSCSLPCVKAHKHRTGCTGKRNQTQFVPLSHFDDNILLSDYNLLEEVKRVADAAHRTRTKLGMYQNYKLPYYLQNLKGAAASRRTKLLFLPNGMSKRVKNQTRYDHRKKHISWTIEWRFHSTNIVLHDHGVDENSSFCSILEKHLKPGPWNHQLREFCEDQVDRLKLFIRTYPKGPKSPFKELDMKAPIRQQLSDIVVLEFPVVFVFLPSHSINFEVIKDVNPRIHQTLQKDSESNLCPEGASFREEVIEDDNSSADPKVFDLLKCVESSSPTQNTNSEKAPNDSFEKPISEVDTGVNLSPSFPKNEELALSGDLQFDSDQDTPDVVFADLIAHLSPEDFIGFDSEYAKLAENEIDLFDTVPGELEDGEIPE